MLRFLIFISIFFYGCSGSGEESNVKKTNLSLNNKKVLLSYSEKDKGEVQVLEQKNGSQLIGFLSRKGPFILKKEFEKELIIHSPGYLKTMDAVRFSTLKNGTRTQYYWLYEKDKLFSYSVNDAKKKITASDNSGDNKRLLNYILNLEESRFAKLPEKEDNVVYSLRDEENVFQSNLIFAKKGDRKIKVTKEEKCLLLVDQKDFDGDGDTDLLVEDVVACGGNCCPNSFFVVAYDGNMKFKISENFNSSWEGIKVEKWKDRWSFVATYVRAGANTLDYYEATKRHILINGKITLVEFFEKEEMKALYNIRAKQFDIKKEGQVKVFEFDIDGDGVKEKIKCRLWNRWGVVQCEVKKGEKILVKVSGKRAGFLKTKSSGFHDIVVNHDVIHKWNGKKYEVFKKSD